MAARKKQEKVSKPANYSIAIADKTLISAALIALVENISRGMGGCDHRRSRIAVSGLRYGRGNGGRIISASGMGKFKMVMQGDHGWPLDSSLPRYAVARRFQIRKAFSGIKFGLCPNENGGDHLTGPGNTSGQTGNAAIPPAARCFGSRAVSNLFEWDYFARSTRRSCEKSRRKQSKRRRCSNGSRTRLNSFGRTPRRAEATKT